MERPKIKAVRLQLGRYYDLRFSPFQKKGISCQFIKVTRCGYNLLNLETSKCVFPRHLYPSRYKNHNVTKDWYFLPANLIIHKIIESEK